MKKLNLERDVNERDPENVDTQIRSNLSAMTRFASWTMPSRGCRLRAFKERKMIFAGRVRVGSSLYFTEVW